jgi:hypothetical protein
MLSWWAMAAPYVDPGPWLKFWWKGVDLVFEVAKSSLAALIVAVAVYFTWEKKKRREIELLNEGEVEKQKALAAETARVAHEARIASLKSELSFLIGEANRLTTEEGASLNELRTRYLSWLSTTELERVGNNGAIGFEWRRKSFVNSPTFDTPQSAAERLSKNALLLSEFRAALKQTELPPDNKLSYLSKPQTLWTRVFRGTRRSETTNG